MKHHASRILLLMVLFASSAISAAAAPPSTLLINNSQSASATFTSVSSDGCTQTDVSIFVIAGTEHHPPGPPEDLAIASINIQLVSLCDPNTGSVSLSGEVCNPAFHYDRQLRFATLDTTIEVFEVFGEPPVAIVDVELTWTGTGELLRTHTHDVDSAPTFTAVFNGTGTVREAQAEGTITDGTTNFTPLPSVTGNLSSGHFVELVFEH